jgi:hypothetical protein
MGMTLVYLVYFYSAVVGRRVISSHMTSYNGGRNMYGCKVNVVYEPPEDGLI